MRNNGPPVQTNLIQMKMLSSTISMSSVTAESFEKESSRNQNDLRQLLRTRFQTLSSYQPVELDGSIIECLGRSSTRSENLRLASVLLEALRWDYRPFSSRWVSRLDSEGLEKLGASFGLRFSSRAVLKQYDDVVRDVSESNDSTAESRRYQKQDYTISEHHGEALVWGVYAYRALQKTGHTDLNLAHVIGQEALRELLVFERWLEDGPSVSLVQAAILIDSNLKALENALFQAELIGKGESLEAWYRVGIIPQSSLDHRVRRLRRLVQAVSVSENWRQFTCAAPKCLRSDPALLPPKHPFLDGFGAQIAESSILTSDQKFEVLRFLIDFWHLKPNQILWSRAVSGLWNHLLEDERKRFETENSESAKRLKSGLLSHLIAVDQVSYDNRLMVSAYRAARAN